MSEAQIAGGHKATLNNPKVSDEAKQHSKKVLDEEFNGGDVPKSGEKADGDKNPGNVAGGLKSYVSPSNFCEYELTYRSTLNNPKTSDEAKSSARERLGQMPQ